MSGLLFQYQDNIPKYGLKGFLQTFRLAIVRTIEVNWLIRTLSSEVLDVGLTQ